MSVSDYFLVLGFWEPCFGWCRPLALYLLAVGVTGGRIGWLFGMVCQNSSGWIPTVPLFWRIFWVHWVAHVRQWEQLRAVCVCPHR